MIIPIRPYNIPVFAHWERGSDDEHRYDRTRTLHLKLNSGLRFAHFRCRTCMMVNKKLLASLCLGRWPARHRILHCFSILGDNTHR